MTFKEWMNIVDTEIEYKTFLTSSDFEDWGWMGEYESGIDPDEAAILFLTQMSDVFA